MQSRAQDEMPLEESAGAREDIENFLLSGDHLATVRHS
jgi:hypothetical protein